MRRLVVLLALLGVPLPGAAAPPHAVTAHPFGSDVPLEQIDIAAYQATLNEGDSISFDPRGIRHVMIDEASVISTATVGEKLVLTAQQEGKAAVRLIWMEDPGAKLSHEQKHGMRVPRTLFFLTVKPRPNQESDE